MRYIRQHPYLTYLTYIPPEDISPRCRRCRFGDTAASGAGTNGFHGKDSRNQRFARTAKARIGTGRDNRRRLLLASDLENDLDGNSPAHRSMSAAARKSSQEACIAASLEKARTATFPQITGLLCPRGASRTAESLGNRF
jgi:hypothetical protein